MKSILMLLFFFVLINTAYANDDRYFDSRKIVTNNTHTKHVKVRHKRQHYAQRQHRNRVHVPAARYAGETYSPDPVQWVAKRTAQGVGEVLGGRPSGAPSAWCGFWLGRHLGMLSRNLWLARNWASVGAPSSRVVGAIAVWKHHVGVITEISANRIKVLSGNDGHRVRNRWRSGGGVIAYRRV